MIYYCTKTSFFKTNDLVSKKYFKSLAKFFMASFQVLALVAFMFGTAQTANAMVVCPEGHTPVLDEYTLFTVSCTPPSGSGSTNITTPADGGSGNQGGGGGGVPNIVEATGLRYSSDSSFDVGMGPDSKITPSDSDSETQRVTGLRVGRFTSKGTTQTVITLPFSYAFPLADPRYGVVISTPFTYVETDGTESFALSFTGGLRVPVYDNWTITPSLSIGAGGSVNLDTVNSMVGAAVASSFRWSAQNLNYELGNMVGFKNTATEKSSVGNKGLKTRNTTMKNGISVSKDTSRELFGDPTTWEFALFNTQISGDAVSIDDFTDISFSYGTVASKNGFTWDSVRLGLTYTFTNKDYKGLEVNFGYQF